MRWARASMFEVSGFKWLLVARGFVPGPPATAGGSDFYLTSKYSIAFTFQLPPTRARM